MNCYYKELVALSGKHCGTCGSKTTSSIWYNDKVQSGKYLCAKCYARVEKADKESEKNRRKRKRGNGNNYNYNNKKRVSIREEEKLGEREKKGGRI